MLKMVYPLSPPFMKAKLSYQKYTGLVQIYCVNAFASFLNSQFEKKHIINLVK